MILKNVGVKVSILKYEFKMWKKKSMSIIYDWKIWEQNVRVKNILKMWWIVVKNVRIKNVTLKNATLKNVTLKNVRAKIWD